MYGKTFIWHLRSGNKTGQETREIKRADGYAFIERLKAEGENILHIEEQSDKIVIQLEDK